MAPKKRRLEYIESHPSEKHLWTIYECRSFVFTLCKCTLQYKILPRRPLILSVAGAMPTCSCVSGLSVVTSEVQPW
jgi:hypothetical protein